VEFLKKNLLGPTLLLVFINDIEESIESTIRLFADDLKLYGPLTSQVNDKIKSETDKLVQWGDKWLLSVLHYILDMINL